MYKRNRKRKQIHKSLFTVRDYVSINLTNMTKFYEVSKVLDKRTDGHGRVQFLVRWRGYEKRYDSWVDEDNTNECLRQVYRTHHQGNPGLLQTLAVLIAEKLNMKKPPTTSIVRRSSVTMPMDSETFRELFSGLPSAPNLLQVAKFSVPVHELDTIMPPGWSLNTFKTSTTCRLQPGKPVEIALLERKKVFYDHSKCLRCEGGDGAPVACKDVVWKVVYGSTVVKVSFYRERNKPAHRNQPKKRTRLTWAKPRAVHKEAR